MPRYIDADALKKQAYPFPCAIGVEYAVTLRAIDEAPTADAAPVVHGEWTRKVTDGDTLAICSECNYPMSWWYKSKFCTNCGARMDAEGGKANG